MTLGGKNPPKEIFMASKRRLVMWFDSVSKSSNTNGFFFGFLLSSVVASNTKTHFFLQIPSEMEPHQETMAERAWREFHDNIPDEDAVKEEEEDVGPKKKISFLFITAVSLQHSVVTRAVPDLKSLAQKHHLEDVAFQARLHACAEASLRSQGRLLGALADYAKQLNVANDIVPVCFVEHALFDATPLVPDS